MSIQSTIDRLKQDRCFYGRSDGLGNRFEQMIILHGLVEKYNLQDSCPIHYYWNNENQYRVYNGIQDYFTFSKHLRIVNTPCGNKLPLNRVDLECSDSDMRQWSGEAIQPKFEVENEFNLTIHVRCGDKVTLSPTIHEMVPDEYQRIINRGLKWVEDNSYRFPEILIVTDTLEQFVWIRRYLNERVKNKIVSSVELNTQNIPQEYFDFGLLTKSRNTCLFSKYSSYSIIGCAISNIPLTVMNDDIEYNQTHISNRHGVEFEIGGP